MGTTHLSPLDLIRLSALALRRIRHLLVRFLLSFLCIFLSLPLLLLGLLLCFLLCSLLRCGFLGDLPPRVLFLLALVVEALDDWTSGAAELVQLGDVLTFGCIFAVIVEPVLCPN